MDRRTVLLASVGAVHVVACGGEPAESYGEIQLAAITPALLIKAIKISGTTEGSIMKLTVQVRPELYLGTVELTKGAPGAATTGKLSKGTIKLPGWASVAISAELYDFILAESSEYALAIELQYTGKSVVTNVFIEYA